MFIVRKMQITNYLVEEKNKQKTLLVPLVLKSSTRMISLMR